MWYVLAAANALSGDSDLVAGTSLKVPDTGVAKNDSSTFKPYNPNEIVGSTAPGLPYVPPASGCGAVGMIIMAVVAIVVIMYTAGAAAAWLAPNLTAAATAATATTAATAAGAFAGASTMSIGVAALSGTLGAGMAGVGMAAAAIGGFVGSVVSQAAGSAMGVANFSWRKALGSGIASGLSAGIAGAMGGSLSTLMQNSQWGRVAASAALGSMASYAGNEIAGVKNNSFSWKSIAASAVTALVTSKITSKLGEKLNLDYATESGQLMSDLISNMTGGVVGLHTRRAFGFDDKVDYGMIAADAFGNLIGNSITGKYKYDAMNYAEKMRAQVANDAVRPDAASAESTQQSKTATGDVSSSNPQAPAASTNTISITAASASNPVDEAKMLDRVIVKGVRGDLNNLIVWDPSKMMWTYGNSIVLDVASGKISKSTPLAGYRTDGYVNQTKGSTGPTKLSDATLALFKAPDVDKFGLGLSALLANINQGSSGTNFKYHAPLYPLKPYDGLSELETLGGRAGDGAVVAEQGLLYIAKGDGQKVLSSAWSLQKERMIKVAAAGDMNTAINVFKSPSGKTATALTTSAGKYSTAFRGVGVVGWGATAVEEGVYLTNTYNNNPDKFGYAVGASVTNVVFDGGAIWLGAQTGAGVGAYLAPWTFGLSIPAGGLIGGIAGHFTYDRYVKPDVKQAWTGIKPDDR